MSHTAEIIAVGTELLLGNITNTNASEISRALSAVGVNVFWHTVVGDNPERLREALKIARKRADVILTTGGRKWTQFHSEWRQVKGMREIDPWPVLTVNPETAKEYGISEGDWAEVFNDTGKARLKVKVSPVIKPGMVHATHAWWFPEQDGEAPNYFGAFKSNINTLLPNDSCGRMYKGSPYKSNMCNIRRVTGLDD